VPKKGEYRELFNSDAAAYGGSNVGNAGTVTTEAVASHGRDHSVTLRLPPLGLLILGPTR
jgi:1,4-alpha-glucan branching enzyme